MKYRKFLVRIVFYGIGMLILALGLSLNTKAHLGIAPVASLPYMVSMILDMNFGNAVFLSYVLFVSVELLLTQKGRRLLILLQIPFSLIFTRLINLFDLFLQFEVSSIVLNFLLLFAAIVLIGIGAALSLSTKLVPNPADGIVFALAEYFHRKIGLTKNIFDFSCALISFLLGCIVGTPLLGVGIGTLLCAVGVGRVFEVFNRYLEPWVQKQTGVSQNTKESAHRAAAYSDVALSQTIETVEE